MVKSKSLSLSNTYVLRCTHKFSNSDATPQGLSDGPGGVAFGVRQLA
jgi:hypothetical protein